MYILITNFHSIKNKGDLGIVLGLIKELKAADKNFNFGIIGRSVEERGWWEAQEIDFFIPLLDYPIYKNGWGLNYIINKINVLRYIGDYYLSLIIVNYPKLSRWYYRNYPEKIKTLGIYFKADIIISKGGSFFREPEYKINIFPIGIMRHLHQLIVGYKLKKAVVLSAQSFGPINNPFSKIIMRRALRRFSLITTRETDSAIFLKTMIGSDDNIISAGDSAFLLKIGDKVNKSSKIISSIIKDKEDGYICVGLTARFWSHKDQYQVYLSSLASLIDDYTSRSFRFYLMPQVVGPSSSEDDRITFKKIINILSRAETKKLIRVIEDELEINDLLNLYHQMDYFLATRLHSAIFALLGNVPVMAIGYEPKTLSLFKDLNLSQFASDIRFLSPESVKKSFEGLLKAPKEVFQKARLKGVLSANINIEEILKIIKNVKNN